MIAQLATATLLACGALLAATPAYAGETAVTSSNTLPVSECVGSAVCVSTSVSWSVDEHVVHPPYNFCGTQYLVYGDDVSAGTGSTSYSYDVAGFTGSGTAPGVSAGPNVPDVVVQTPC